MMLLGKLRCWWSGEHLRGRLIDVVSVLNGKYEQIPTQERTYECPRCKARWSRRVKRFPKAQA
jgi:hypothetical protein